MSAPTNAGITVLGDNEVTGAVDNFNTNGDSDLLTFSVAPGHQISSFTLNFFEGGGGHFFGFVPGATAPGSPSTYYVATLVPGGFSQPIDVLGIQPSDLGSFASGGVPAVLGAGDYTLFFNETALGDFHSYSATLGVTAVPEPATVLALLPLGYLAYRRRQRILPSNA